MSTIDIPGGATSTGFAPERAVARAPPRAPTPSASPPVAAPEKSSESVEEPIDQRDQTVLLEKLRDAAARHHPNLHFSIDEHSGRAVVQVIDRESGEVIRQIPSEQALRAVRALASGEAGALLELTA